MNYFDEIMNDPEVAALLRARAAAAQQMPAEVGDPAQQLPADLMGGPPMGYPPVDPSTPPPPIQTMPQQGPPMVPPPEPAVTGETAALQPDPYSMDRPPVPGSAPAPPPLPAFAQPNMPPAPLPHEMSIDAPGGDTKLLYDSREGMGSMQRPAPQQGSGGFKGYLKRALPNMITAGLTSLATPSRYGGGPLDIAGGVLAGEQAIEKKSDKAKAEARQHTQDDIAAAKAASEIAMQGAQGRHYDASAKALETNANTKATMTDREQAWEKMQKAPAGSKEWEAAHQLWLEATGHPVQQKNLWRKTSVPGVEINEKGELMEVDPDAAKNWRVDQVRLMLGPSVSNKQLWPEWAVMQKATPAQQQFVLTGKWPTTQAEHEPTMMGLSMKAAQGDKTAQRAIDIATQPKITAAEAAAERRQEAQNKAFLKQADTRYQEDLKQAQLKYNADKAKLDALGTRPGSAKPETPALKSKMAWSEYDQRNAELIRILNDEKNAAHRAHEAAQATYAPEGYEPHAGYGPNSQPLPTPGQFKSPSAKQFDQQVFGNGSIQ